MSTFVNTSIPEMPIREFGSKYNKNIHKAPLIITKGKKKAFIVLPYEQYEVMQKMLHPIITVSSDQGIKQLTDAFGRDPFIKPTLPQRLKEFFTKKIF